VTIELPDIDSLRLTPNEARLELAVGLYAGRRVTLGHGAKIAGVSHTQFMREVGRRGIRATMRNPSDGAMPHSTEEAVKMMMQTISTHLRPK
jgi:hypothetical protein